MAGLRVGLGFTVRRYLAASWESVIINGMLTSVRCVCEICELEGVMV